MWVASKHGFYSIVQKSPGCWHVRARVKRDLRNLCKAAGLNWKLIKNWNTSDYRYRILIDPLQLLRVFQVLARSIDYPNFKAEIDKTPDQKAKHHSYAQIWGIMAEHQPFTPKQKTEPWSLGIDGDPYSLRA